MILVNVNFGKLNSFNPFVSKFCRILSMATIECAFTLKRVRDMTTTYSQKEDFAKKIDSRKVYENVIYKSKSLRRLINLKPKTDSSKKLVFFIPFLSGKIHTKFKNSQK